MKKNPRKVIAKAICTIIVHFATQSARTFLSLLPMQVSERANNGNNSLIKLFLCPQMARQEVNIFLIYSVITDLSQTFLIQPIPSAE